MEINELRLLAFRYALGRKTYIVSELVEDLTNNWDTMSKYHKQIQDDIKGAIRRNDAGMDMDVELWESILTLKTANQ